MLQRRVKFLWRKIFPMTKKAYILIGVPGSGKSTWVKQNHNQENTVILSTDNFIQDYADLSGKTYSEVFPDKIKWAQIEMKKDLKYAIENNLDVIHDQTNLTRKSRRMVMQDLIKAKYDITAVIFPIPLDLDVRLKSRPGKNIPDHVIQMMIKNFKDRDNYPTYEEGFDRWVICS